MKEKKRKENSIERLRETGQDLDVGNEEGAYIAKYLNRPIIVFCENENKVGEILCRRPDGSSEIRPWSQTFLKDSILVYYTSYGQNGHYQAII